MAYSTWRQSVHYVVHRPTGVVVRGPYASPYDAADWITGRGGLREQLPYHTASRTYLAQHLGYRLSKSGEAKLLADLAAGELQHP